MRSTRRQAGQPASGPVAGLAAAAALPPVRRTRHLALLTALLFLLVLAGATGSLFLYGSVRNELDRQLGRRLMSIAETAARGIGSGRLLDLMEGSPGSPGYERLRSELEEMARVNDLDNLTILDSERAVILDLYGSSGDGVRDPFIDLQPELLTTILSGEPMTTRLVEVEGLPGEYLKTGYAAFEDSAGRILGAMAVEGGSDFFSVLPGLRRTLRWAVIVGVGSAMVIVLLIYGVLRSLVRYEESLRRAAALAAIGQISAIVAHEVRNPLAIIRSRAERVRVKIEAGKPTGEILEWFEAIPAEVDRLNGILTTYLSLARPDAPGESSSNPARVVRETLALLEPDMGKQGIGVNLDFEMDDAEAAIGARSCRQILLNLILNATQAMPAGGTLAIRLKRRRGLVVLEVEDNGSGMTEAEARRAAEPFFTTRESGSGLGLTLVQSLVHARGGTLEIRSQPGRGTRVSVLLPAAGRRSGEAAAGEAAPDDAKGSRP